MRLAAAVATLITVLLGGPAGALAAVEHGPRMERVNACSWDRPGHNPFMGDTVAAIDRYIDIPTPVRVKLKLRMQARQYDDLVDIRRDDISGRARYEPAIRDMHFGLDRVCRQVTRERWTAQMHERGLVYCESGHCILVPTVCRNVSRIERRPAAVAGAREGGRPEGERGIAPPSGGPAAVAAGGAVADVLGAHKAMPSFAETVAGASTVLWPTDGAAQSGGGRDGHSGGGSFGTGMTGEPTLREVVGGFGGGTGANGGGFGVVTGNIPGGSGAPCAASGSSDGGVMSSCPLGGGTGDRVTVPAAIAPVPEPSTWLSLLTGLGLLAVTVSRRQGRKGAPRCATQKRS